MNILDILQTIGAVASIIWLLTYIGDRRQRIIGPLLHNRGAILFWLYIIVAALFTLYNLTMFVLLPILLDSFSVSLAALLAIIFLSTIALWSPILFGDRLQYGWIKRSLLWVISALSAFVFTGYWIISWPDNIFTASLLTAVVVIMILIYFLIKYWGVVITVFRHWFKHD